MSPMHVTRNVVVRKILNILFVLPGTIDEDGVGLIPVKK